MRGAGVYFLSQQAHFKNIASLVGKVLLTGIALAILKSKIDISSALKSLLAINPWGILIVLGLQSLQIMLCAFRWQIVLWAIGSHLPFWQAAKLFSIGNFFGQILPGAVGGDAIRIWKTQQSHIGISPATNSILLERAATVLGLILLALIWQGRLASYLPDPSLLKIFPLLALGGSMGLILLACLDKIIPSKPLSNAVHHRGLRALLLLSKDCRLVFLSPKFLLALLTIIILAHLNLIVVMWAITQSSQKPVDLRDCLALMPAAILVATLPLSIAGWGTREVAMIWLFGLIGVPPSQAAAFSILFGLSGLIISLPGGGIWFFSSDRKKLKLETKN
jgi:uncharacterized membrane protein YbhN (UPF0104 family)